MSKAKLLVVEDERHLLLGLKDILELDNYEVLTAENGQVGLEILESEEDNPPDLIISDIMMPQMDGLEFLQRVREREKWVTIPFMFLTAKGEKQDVFLGKNLGVDEYLIKPFEAEVLLNSVESKLKRAAAINNAQQGTISAIKRNILTMLNHEFRTPLTLVVAYADMLKDFSVDSMSQDELLEFLKGVNSGADRLRRLIENFILLVEIDSGDAGKTMDWRQRVIQNAEVLINDSVENLGKAIANCNVVIDNQSQSMIRGDYEYLVIAVRELLDNAAKFSKHGDNIDVKLIDEDGFVVISITDYGRGIPQHELDKIWNSFYQINREHHEDQGSGAGLAIVKGVIELHKGSVTVQSTPDQGSTFVVHLPAYTENSGS